MKKPYALTKNVLRPLAKMVVATSAAIMKSVALILLVMFYLVRLSAKDVLITATFTVKCTRLKIVRLLPLLHLLHLLRLLLHQLLLLLSAPFAQRLLRGDHQDVHYIGPLDVIEPERRPFLEKVIRGAVVVEGRA